MLCGFGWRCVERNVSFPFSFVEGLLLVATSLLVAKNTDEKKSGIIVRSFLGFFVVFFSSESYE